MKLVWHIMAKDLRRAWPMVALLAALIVAKLGIGVAMLHVSGPLFRETFLDLTIIANVLIALEVLVTVVLVAAVVHEDRLVGTDAFWLTRPIAGWRLLAAKLLLLVGALVLLPIALTVPWWLANGFGPYDVRSAIVESLLVKGGLVAVCLPFAALSREYGRYFVLAISVVFAAGVGMWWANSKVGLTSDAVIATRDTVLVIIVLAAIAAVVMTQFLTRRLVAAGVQLTIALLLLVAVTRSWRWDWSGLGDYVHERNAPSRAVTVTYRETRLSRAKEGRGFVMCQIAQIPEGAMVGTPVTPRAKQRWVWPNGEVLRLPGLYQTSYNTKDLRCILGLGDFRPETSSGLGYPIIGSRETTLMIENEVGPQYAKRLTVEPCRYEGEVRLYLMRPRVASPVILEESAELRTGHFNVRVFRTDITRTSRAASVVTRQRALLSDVRGPALGTALFFARTEMLLLGIDHETGALFGNGSGRLEAGARIAGVGITCRTVELTPPSGAGARDPAALQRAKLVMIGFDVLDSFDRSITADGVLVQATPDKITVR